jgi:hypothetical protein
VLFCLLYINQLPISVDRTQNVLYIIQRRSETLIGALFVCYISINCLYQWIVPKMYYISSNADRKRRSEQLDVLFRLLYINQLPVVEWSGVYPKCITYHPTPIGATSAFRLLYINQLPVSVDRTQNVLYNIQRRSEQLALFVCYI